MNKRLILFVVMIFVTFFATSTLSHPTKKTIELTINSTDALVNGEKKTLEQAPIIMNQRTLVPLRFIGEEMGAKVEWDQVKQKITMSMDYTPYYKEKLSLLQASEQTPVGNTTGNLANEAKFVLYKDWVYTLFPFEKRSENGDFVEEWKIIRMRSDGSDVTPLRVLFNADKMDPIIVGMLNIVDDYMYFALKTDTHASFIGSQDQPAKLYKAHIERNDTQVLFEGIFNSMFVYGDWIYLTVSEKLIRGEPWKHRYLYRMKTDGSHLELLLPESTYYPMMYQGFLYATIEFETECGIYRMLPDGSNRVNISNRMGARIQGYGGWIYFIDFINDYSRSIDFAEGEVYRLRLDGTEENVVFKGKVFSLNGANDWMYFIDQRGLYRWHSIYGDLLQLHGECDDLILLFHDWIYLVEDTKMVEGEWVGGEEFRMRTDGSNKEMVYPFE